MPRILEKQERNGAEHKPSGSGRTAKNAGFFCDRDV